MSKNAELNNLSASLDELPEALSKGDHTGATVILARVVTDFSGTAWGDLQKNGKVKDWQIIPLDDAAIDHFQESLPVSQFREAFGVLEQKTFNRLLARELLRLERNGGCLSLIGAALFNRKKLERSIGAPMLGHLQDLLGRTLLHEMAECDSLGLLREGEFVCSLPGFGQLAARNFAERCQREFSRAAEGALGQPDSGATCALGIVNIMQGEHPALPTLLSRARSTLEVALAKEGRQIYQETSSTPLEGTTLVHSSEKRFLFFGEDPS